MVVLAAILSKAAEEMTMLTGGGQDTFVIRRGDGTDIITDFGGEAGVRPTAER